MRWSPRRSPEPAPDAITSYCTRLAAEQYFLDRMRAEDQKVFDVAAADLEARLGPPGFDPEAFIRTRPDFNEYEWWRLNDECINMICEIARRAYEHGRTA